MPKVPKWAGYALSFIFAGLMTLVQMSQTDRQIEQLGQQIGEEIVRGMIESAESIQPAEESENEDA